MEEENVVGKPKGWREFCFVMTRYYRGGVVLSGMMDHPSRFSRVNYMEFRKHQKPHESLNRCTILTDSKN